MRTSLDTNIISLLWSKEATAQQVRQYLAHARQQGTLILSGFVYAEIRAHPLATEHFLNTFLEDTGIETDLRVPEALWRLAGDRFAQYADRRRAAGDRSSPRRILADFLIGAHALLQADRLMTFDTTFYQRNYPELRLYPLSA